jgi:hypothetical protein
MLYCGETICQHIKIEKLLHIQFLIRVLNSRCTYKHTHVIPNFLIVASKISIYYIGTKGLKKQFMTVSSFSAGSMPRQKLLLHLDVFVQQQAGIIPSHVLHPVAEHLYP